jgi:hypothetical protein
MLSGKIIQTYKLSNKLDHKLHGCFKITEVISEIAIRLNRTVKCKIHTAFHILLLDLFIQRNPAIYLESFLNTANLIVDDYK